MNVLIDEFNKDIDLFPIKGQALYVDIINDYVKVVAKNFVNWPMILDWVDLKLN